MSIVDHMVKSSGDGDGTGGHESASCACGPRCEPGVSTKKLRVLPIAWQRLVTDGGTCPRCGSTETQIEQAVTTLTEVLRPLGIEPRLEARALDEVEFERSPSESNRVFIAGRALEDWVGASVGASECCSVCGSNDCRTVEVEGRTLEVVPEQLIVKAGLVAAASLLDA
jgi:hypothetical protein